MSKKIVVKLMFFVTISIGVLSVASAGFFVPGFGEEQQNLVLCQVPAKSGQGTVLVSARSQKDCSAIGGRVHAPAAQPPYGDPYTNSSHSAQQYK